jgi:hypothetical protein
MTIATLLNAHSAIQALYSAQLDGKRALAVRRAVRKMNEPLADYEAARKQFVEDNGLDGAQLDTLTEEQRTYWRELHEADVEQTWEPVLGPDDLDRVELSAVQLDALIEAGLVRDELETD